MSSAESRAGPPVARLSGKPREILESYLSVQEVSKATVAGEIRSSNAFLSYFAIRRADRDEVIGKEQLRDLLKSAEPLHRAAGAAASMNVLGVDLTHAVAPLLADPHPAPLEAALDALTTTATPSKAGAALLEALPRLPTPARHRAIEYFGKIRYRGAVARLEELFSRRDAVDSPAACRALAAILGRAFTDAVTEYLYPDNPIELHIAILECMAEHPAPVYFSKAAQMLKTSRNKLFSIEIIRRLALWSTDGMNLALTLLGSSDIPVADAAQTGITRQLSNSSVLPQGFLQNLSKMTFEKDSAEYSGASRFFLPDHLESLDRKLAALFSGKPDAEFQQLFYMGLTAEKHFLKPKLVQLAASRWGKESAKTIEEAFNLNPQDSGLLKMRLQNRAAKQTEQQSSAIRLARMIESVGEAKLKSPVREIARHLDTPNLPVQMATVAALSSIGGMTEVQDIEKRLPAAHWMLKRKMALTLSRLTRDNPTDGLFKLCEDAESLVRISAVRSLEWIRHEKAYNILLRSLGDLDERVRSAACACLRIFPGRKDVVVKLRQMLQDSDARVRANSVESLDCLLSQDPQELSACLKPLLGDPNARVVINTAKALFRLDPGLSMPVLESYLRAPDSNLRAGALWALGQLKRPDAFICLHFHSLREKDPYVRTFVDKGVALMQDHPFYRDAKYLLLDPGLSAQ